MYRYSIASENIVILYCIDFFPPPLMTTELLRTVLAAVTHHQQPAQWQGAMGEQKQCASVHPFPEKEAKLKNEQAEREAKALLEKARLDPELSALTLQREAAATVAQAEILEAAEEQLHVPDDKIAKKSSKEECMQRTTDYITQQDELQNYSCCDDFVPVKQEESLVTWDKPLES